MNKELEVIYPSNPSEALECLEHIKKNDFNMIITTYPPLPAYNGVTKNEMFNKIEQYILKSQEQEKFLDDKLIFKNECVMSGFEYKGKPIVAMPLDTYNEFMGQEKVLNYLMQFVKDVNVSDNGEYYISFKNDTSWLDCIKIDEEHFKEFNTLKRFLEKGKSE